MHFALEISKWRKLPHRLRRRTFQIVIVVVVFWIICWYPENPIEPESEYFGTGTVWPPPLILWWNLESDLIGIQDCTRFKPQACIFTKDRSQLSQAKLVIYDAVGKGSELMPLPRRKNQLWTLFTRDSPKNSLQFMHSELLQHFNFSATFSRLSQVWLPSYIPGATTSVIHSQSVRVKNEKRASLAPITFIEFDCYTPTARTEFVRELMTYIDVDSYGSCLYNRQPPTNVIKDFRNKSYTTEFFTFLAPYKFMLVIEDIVCDDFVTDKFWLALAAGVVPIYFGSPTIEDFAPDSNSVIYISNYGSAKALAEYLHKLDRDDEAYNTYLQYKKRNLKNRLLNAIIYSNQEGMHWKSHDSSMKLIGCNICYMLSTIITKMNDIDLGVNRGHCDCPIPLKHLTAKIKSDTISDWIEIERSTLCRAKVLDGLVRMNRRYTLKEYEALHQKSCNYMRQQS